MEPSGTDIWRSYLKGWIELRRFGLNERDRSLVSQRFTKQSLLPPEASIGFVGFHLVWTISPTCSLTTSMLEPLFSRGIFLIESGTLFASCSVVPFYIKEAIKWDDELNGLSEGNMMKWMTYVRHTVLIGGLSGIWSFVLIGFILVECFVQLLIIQIILKAGDYQNI